MLNLGFVLMNFRLFAALFSIEKIGLRSYAVSFELKKKLIFSSSWRRGLFKSPKIRDFPICLWTPEITRDYFEHEHTDVMIFLTHFAHNCCLFGKVLKKNLRLLNL